MDEIKNEELFNKAFNHGYFLRQEAPEIYDDLVKNDTVPDDYINGLKKGSLEAEKELSLGKEISETDRVFDDLKKDDLNPDIEPEIDLDIDED